MIGVGMVSLRLVIHDYRSRLVSRHEARNFKYEGLFSHHQTEAKTLSSSSMSFLVQSSMSS